MISVVIPVRNRANIVMRTLRSIDEQTQRPDKVIVVDNCSTDNTMDVLQEWAQGKDRVRVESAPAIGAAKARNVGLAHVDSEYVLFFDSDDYMPPHHIEEIERAIRFEGFPRICAFDMTLVDLNGNTHSKNFRRGDPMLKHIFHSILSTQRCVLSTELMKNIGGWDEDLSVWDDWVLGIRLLATHPKVHYIRLSEPPIVYAQSESLTGTDFHSKAGLWEKSLDAASAVLANTKYARFIDYRRAILAGNYRREGHPELAYGMIKGRHLKCIEQYVAIGGRGVEWLARLFVHASNIRNQMQ